MGVLDQENPKLHGAIAGVAVTPSDTTDLGCTRALYIGGTGDLAVRFVGSSTTITFVGVQVGTILSLQVHRVMAATTATDIVALY